MLVSVASAPSAVAAAALAAAMEEAAPQRGKGVKGRRAPRMERLWENPAQICPSVLSIRLLHFIGFY